MRTLALPIIAGVAGARGWTLRRSEAGGRRDRAMSRGFWKEPCTFTFVLDLLGKLDHYTFDIAFSGDAADVSLNERTGLMRENVRARRTR